MKPKFHGRAENSWPYPGAVETVHKFSPVFFKMYRPKPCDSNLKSNI